MIKYIFMLVLVLISSPVFSQLPATDKNRIYADYNEYTHDYTEATALDKDPPVNDPNDTDTIMKARSLAKAQNLDTGVHSWTVKSWINCYSGEYEGTWGLAHHTPHIVKESINANKGGRFDGVFYKEGSMRGEIAGVRDCRASILDCRASGGLTGYKKKNASGSPSEGQNEDMAWANSLIPEHVNPGPEDEPKIGPQSPGLFSTNGSYYAYPGETHEAKVITSEPYYYVRWYIKGPCDTSSLGTLVQTDEGWSTGTETEASLSWTFSTGAVSGEWTITAVSERYSNLSQGSTRSYTVNVF